MFKRALERMHVKNMFGAVFSLNQTLQTCLRSLKGESHYQLSFSLLASSSGQQAQEPQKQELKTSSTSSKQPKNYKYPNPNLNVHVAQDTHASRDAQTKSKRSLQNLDRLRLQILSTLYLFWSNRRLRLGIILLLIVAPATKFIYLAFPKSGFGEFLINSSWITVTNFLEPEGWFYINLYYFFFGVGELAAPMVTVLGIFFLFPKGYYPSYLSGIPFGYYMSLLVQRIVANSTEAFHNTLPYSIMALFLVFGVIILAISDKVLFNSHHRERSVDARIIGLINMPGMTWKEKEPLLKEEAKKATQNGNEWFDKEAS